MISRFSVSLFIVLFASIAAVAQAQSDWVKFSPEGGRFSVLMPAEPKADVQNATAAIGPYTTHVFTSPGKGQFYIAAWVDYAPTVRLNVPAEIDANRDNFIKGVNAKLVSERKITFEGNPGLEFNAELPSGLQVVSRIYVVGQRPYQLAVITQKDSGSAEAARFLDSFKLTAK